jgi:hypothetical protein
VGTRQFVVWPDTTGSLVQTTIGLNGAVRAGSARTVNVTVSGGLAVYRVSGATQPLGFTAFRLGGHSVLFSDEYRVGVSLGPETTVGFDIGAEVNLPVGRRSAVVIGYRYLGGPSVDVPVTPATIPPIKSSTRCRSPRCRGSSCPVRRMSASPRRAS